MTAGAMVVNGQAASLGAGWAEEKLLSFLRFHLRLAGVRFGRGAGLCGACTVLLDGGVAPCRRQPPSVGASPPSTASPPRVARP